MSVPRVRLLVVTVAVLGVASLLGVTWLTCTDNAPVRALSTPGVAPSAPAEPAQPPAMTPPPAADCPGELSRDVLNARRFSETWAMCRLYGNHDAERGTSRSRDAQVRIALSSGFEDGPAERHLLVLARDATESTGAVRQGRRASMRLEAAVFERGAGGWRFITSGEVGAPEARGQLPRLELLRLGRTRHGLLIGGARSDLATVHGVSEMGIPALLEDVPLGGSNAGECAPPRCFEWKADVSFERGKNPDYDDAVIRVTGMRPDDDERVWRVDETTRWVWRGGRYHPEP